MKGAEFYEGGRIQVDIWEKERERRRWKRGSRKVWVEFGGGEGEREKEERNMKRDKTKKKGSHTVESTDTRETRSHLPTSSLTLCTLFFTAFQPWNHLPTGLERKRKGKEESRFCFFDRGRRWKFFYFNWSKNFAFKSWRIMETFIFLREIFFFFRKNSNISNSIPRHKFREGNVKF